MWFEFFSRSFSSTTLGLTTEICGRKQLGKKQAKKNRLVCKCISPNLKTKRKKRFLFLSHLVKSQEVMQRAHHFRLFFLKRLKEGIMNSITFEVAISKNKRARHVVENNRFVLAGLCNLYL